MEQVSYTVKINPASEGGYWAEVPALPGCFTQAETIEEATTMLRESIELYLSGLTRRGEQFPIEKRQKQSFIFPVSIQWPRRT